MELTVDQRQQFSDKGFVHLPGIVPAELVDRALRAINHSLGNGIDIALIDRFRSQSYVPDVQGSKAITDTFNATPLLRIFENLLDTEIKQVSSAQVALRFPSLSDEIGAGSPHIDGTYAPNNGVAKGEIASFTGLCHILLSDLPQPNCANFKVWPGTHHKYAEYFRQHGYQTLSSGTPSIDLPEPVQIIGKAGDAVIAHYLLGHTVSTHIGPHIRYGLFFRIKHPNHVAHQEQALLDPFFGWPGLRSHTHSR